MARKKIESDKSVYDLAIERAAYAMSIFDKVLVMFSGGKDSTATLHVVLEAAHSDPAFARHLPMRVVFYDEEAIPFETEQYVRRVAQRDDVALEWYCLPMQHRNACSRKHPHWYPWAPEDEAKWCRPLPPEALTTLPGFPINPPEARPSAPHMMGLLAPDGANTGFFMGIRAQESLTRTRAVTAKTVDNFIIKYDEHTDGNVYKVYPVYDWRTEDVWTAPKLYGWDWNRAYDHMEMAGLSPSMQRCSPAFGEEPLQKIWTYATCFPDVWAKMTERVPGIGAAHRYALTELYGYRDRPTKPPGMPWSEFILHYLEKFGDDTASKIANRLRQEIVRHYKMTSTPIAPTARHPLTGLSWKWMLTVAMRGDLKGRKQVLQGLGTSHEDLVKRWHVYIAELEQVVADGTEKELGHPRPFPANVRVWLPDYAKEPA